jgi:hypothetical protein
MFKIVPIQDFQTQIKYAELCNRSAKEGYFAYAMVDANDGTPMGFSQFEVNGEYGYLSDLSPVTGVDDFEAMFILGRQTLNFIDKCGAHMCKADKSTSDRSLLLSIGFKTENDLDFICDMNGMFDGHCDHKS